MLQLSVTSEHSPDSPVSADRVKVKTSTLVDVAKHSIINQDFGITYAVSHHTTSISKNESKQPNSR